MKVENSLTCPLAPVSLSLRCLVGIIRKFCKSGVLDRCFLDLASFIRILLKARVIVQDLENTLKNQQYETVYVFCNISNEKNKTCRKKLRGSCRQYT